MNPQAPYDLTRITLIVLIIGVLIAGSLWTLLPFLSALIWATTIVVATWPLLLRVQRVAGDRRWIATTVMLGVMLAIFVVPFWLAVGKLLAAAAQGVELVRAFLAQGLAPPPEWIERLPLVGDNVAAKWRELAARGPRRLRRRCGHTRARRQHGCSRSLAAWGQSSCISFSPWSSPRFSIRKVNWPHKVYSCSPDASGGSVVSGRFV